MRDSHLQLSQTCNQGCFYTTCSQLQARHVACSAFIWRLASSKLCSTSGKSSGLSVGKLSFGVLILISQQSRHCMQHHQDSAAGLLMVHPPSQVQELMYILHAGSNSWGFPQQQHMADEGISDTARRAIEGVIGNKPQVSSKEQPDCFFPKSRTLWLQRCHNKSSVQELVS